MASTEERLQILKMIEEGKITASEAAELLRALDQDTRPPKPDPLKGASPARWFRVRITDTRNGRSKANINIPVGLVNVGIKMGARFTSNVEGFDYDEISKAIRSGKQGKIADFMNQAEDERIEIFLE